MSESDSESVESCYTCGIFLDDDKETYVVGFSTTSSEMRQFCSKQCCDKNTKHRLTKTDPENPFQVPVRGKCGDVTIDGVAEFNIHGTVALHFTQPELKGSFVIPKAFLGKNL